MPTKTVIGVTTINGGDALVASDGSISALIEVNGANGNYFVSVPVDVVAALKSEDSGNADYSALPGYVPSAGSQVAPPSGAPGVGTQAN